MQPPGRPLCVQGSIKSLAHLPCPLFAKHQIAEWVRRGIAVRQGRLSVRIAQPQILAARPDVRPRAYKGARTNMPAKVYEPVWRCIYCRKEHSKSEPLSLEHIVPYAFVGNDGILLPRAEQTQLYLCYDGEVGSGSDNHALNLGVRIRW